MYTMHTQTWKCSGKLSYSWWNIYIYILRFRLCSLENICQVAYFWVFLSFHKNSIPFIYAVGVVVVAVWSDTVFFLSLSRSLFTYVPLARDSYALLLYTIADCLQLHTTHCIRASFAYQLTPIERRKKTSYWHWSITIVLFVCFVSILCRSEMFEA